MGDQNPQAVATDHFVVPVPASINSRLVNAVPMQRPGGGLVTPTMPRPSPAISNRGLVIVQVENEAQAEGAARLGSVEKDRRGRQEDAEESQVGDESCGTSSNYRLLPVYDSVLKANVPQGGTDILMESWQAANNEGGESGITNGKLVPVLAPTVQQHLNADKRPAPVGKLKAAEDHKVAMSHRQQQLDKTNKGSSEHKTASQLSSRATRTDAGIKQMLSKNVSGGDAKSKLNQLDILCSATHQLIHGYPPGSSAVAEQPQQLIGGRHDGERGGVGGSFLAEDFEEDFEEVDEEVDEEDEEEEEEDDFEEVHGEDLDEGYRTNSSTASGSPSSSVHSPGPREEQRAGPRADQVGVQSSNAERKVVEGSEDSGEENNLMWLVDFKLDFFNDIDKCGEKDGEQNIVLGKLPEQDNRRADPTAVPARPVAQTDDILAKSMATLRGSVIPASAANTPPSTPVTANIATPPAVSRNQPAIAAPLTGSARNQTTVAVAGNATASAGSPILSQQQQVAAMAGLQPHGTAGTAGGPASHPPPIKIVNGELHQPRGGASVGQMLANGGLNEAAIHPQITSQASFLSQRQQQALLQSLTPVSMANLESSTIPGPPVGGVHQPAAGGIAAPGCGPKSSAKPNYTYTDLITLALKDKRALTVSGIYQWITENYPYYKADDDRWKNSVRHNLSMNPHFRKGTKSKQGAGHVWVLADESQDTLALGGPTGLKLISNEDEAAEAVRNILGNNTVSALETETTTKRRATSAASNSSSGVNGSNNLKRANGQPSASVHHPNSAQLSAVNGRSVLSTASVMGTAVPTSLLQATATTPLFALPGAHAQHHQIYLSSVPCGLPSTATVVSSSPNYVTTTAPVTSHQLLTVPDSGPPHNGPGDQHQLQPHHHHPQQVVGQQHHVVVQDAGHMDLIMSGRANHGGITLVHPAAGHTILDEHPQQMAHHQPQQVIVVDPLQKCAEEIMSGVKRPTGVETNIVQFILPDKYPDSDLQCTPAKRPHLTSPECEMASSSNSQASIPLNLSSGSIVSLSQLTSIDSSSASTAQVLDLTYQQSMKASQPHTTYCTTDQLQEIVEPVYTCEYAEQDIDYEYYYDPDNLEKALGIDFSGVVQRELTAK